MRTFFDEVRMASEAACRKSSRWSQCLGGHTYRSVQVKFDYSAYFQLKGFVKNIFRTIILRASLSWRIRGNQELT